jgi:hypothetical protein
VKTTETGEKDTEMQIYGVHRLTTTLYGINVKLQHHMRPINTINKTICEDQNEAKESALEPRA